MRREKDNDFLEALRAQLHTLGLQQDEAAECRRFSRIIEAGIFQISSNSPARCLGVLQLKQVPEGRQATWKPRVLRRISGEWNTD